jgi:copper chaperone CopZ
MEFHANLHAKIMHCKECKDTITDAYLTVDGCCRHCHTKKLHGVVDINTCFQGSVITLED